MKIAITADLHIHNWPEFSVPHPSGLPSRLHHCVSVLDSIRDYCTVRRIKTLVIAGDLFHKRGVVYTQAYTETVKRLAALKQAGITVIAIDGNHDHADKAGSVHAIQALASAGLVTAVPSSGWLNTEVGDLLISCYSYCDNRTELAQRLAASDKASDKVNARWRLGIFHHGFEGARVGTTLEYQVKESLALDAVSLRKGQARFDFLLSGHYHQAQPINGNPTAWYIGSPLEHVRGDGGLRKGFAVYDSTTNKHEIVPLDLPRFIKLNAEDLNDAESTAEAAHNYVDLLIPAGEDPSPYIAKLEHVPIAGLKVVFRAAEATTDQAQRLDVDLSMTPKKLLARYVKHTRGARDKDLLALGLDLFEQAQED